MSLVSKILLGLLFVASAAFMYAATRTVKTHKAWRSEAQSLQTKIDQQDEQLKKLTQGTPQTEEEKQADRKKETAQKSIREMEIEFNNFVNDRGKFWRFVVHEEIDKATGAVRVRPVSDPDTREPIVHNLGKGALVYLFDSPDDQNGMYVGGFRVIEAPKTPDDWLLLEPDQKPDEEMLAHLAKATNGMWQMYDPIPRDSHDVWHKETEQELAAWLPAGSVDEYLRDGKEARLPKPGEVVEEPKPAEGEEAQPAKSKYDKLENVEYEVRFRKPFKLTIPSVSPDGKPITREKTYLPGTTAYLRADLVEEQDLEKNLTVEVLKKVYVRPLRDYSAAFVEARRIKTTLGSLIAARQDDTKYVKSAAEVAQKRAEAIQAEVTDLQAEEKSITAESEFVKQVLDEQSKRLARGKAQIEALAEQNAKLIDKLAELQEKAVRRAQQSVAESND